MIQGKTIEFSFHSTFQFVVIFQILLLLGCSKGCYIGSLNATLAAGKVVLCFSVADGQGIGAASIAVMEVGRVGLIFAQSRDNLLNPCYFVPCIIVDYEVGTEILSYIRETR